MSEAVAEREEPRPVEPAVPSAPPSRGWRNPDDGQDRDPEKIHPDLKVQFDELFAEPHGTHSDDDIWRLSNDAFTCGKFWCYRIVTLICGLPAAFCWGISYALVFYNVIWCITPYMHCFKILVRPIREIFTQIVGLFCIPWYDAAAHIFSRIRVTVNKGDGENDSPV